MVVEMRELELEGHLFLTVVHVAGTRLIEFGIDGLSRGEVRLETISSPSLLLVPLHLNPLDRHPYLEHWVGEWSRADQTFCEPKDWFWSAHQAGIHFWPLAPAAALEALEQLMVARLKQGESTGAVVLVPNLMQGVWGRRFRKETDFSITIPAKWPEWPREMHEPLILGFSLPLLRCYPWRWGRSPAVVAFARTLSEVFKTDNVYAGDLLRQFWCAARRVPSMPAGLVRRLLSSPDWRQLLRYATKGYKRGGSPCPGG